MSKKMAVVAMWSAVPIAAMLLAGILIMMYQDGESVHALALIAYLYAGLFFGIIESINRKAY